LVKSSGVLLWRGWPDSRIPTQEGSPTLKNNNRLVGNNAINAGLDFLLHFCFNPDAGGIGETNNKITILEPTQTKVERRRIRNNRG
jgi:hypothetical protein